MPVSFIMWTPRCTNLTSSDTTWSSPHKSKFPFAPCTNQEWSAPPPPPRRLQKRAAGKSVRVSSENLKAKAADWHSKADDLDRQKGTAPALAVQLGLLMLSKPDFIKRVLREWDTKGRGEIRKAEFRLNLRNVGLNATSTDADALFDEWDADGGGTLDANELTAALQRVMSDARGYQAVPPNPNVERVKQLRRLAVVAEEAAVATEQADALEDTLRQLALELESRADVRLGELLLKRRVTPGTVITQWSKLRGAHAGEVSKAEFREGVNSLGLTEAHVAISEIDAVFEDFDADHSGYMDADEASHFIKTLIRLAEDAQHDRRCKEREASCMRAKANKKALKATMPLHEPAAAPDDSITSTSFTAGTPTREGQLDSIV